MIFRDIQGYLWILSNTHRRATRRWVGKVFIDYFWKLKKVEVKLQNLEEKLQNISLRDFFFSRFLLNGYFHETSAALKDFWSRASA